MELTTGDIRIRNAGEGDAAQLARWWNDGAVMAHAGFPNGLGTTAERVAADLKTDTDDTRRRLMLEYAGRPIGEMVYRHAGDAAEIGIKICEADFRERGIGRAALSLLIRALFARGYDRIVLDTDLENRRAQHVYESLGFRRLRVNADSWTDQLGRPRSSVDYELSRDDLIDFSEREETEGERA